MKLRFAYNGREKEIIIDVIYSDRSTLGLEVSRNGKVKLRAPKQATDQVLQKFARQKEAWIIEKYLMMEEKQKAQMERELPDYVKYPELEQVYRKKAKEQVGQRAAYFAGQMGVSYEKLSIGAAKTRWGSCSGRGNLNFHWKLILMPPQVLEYVVVHELAHRKEMNHSPAFWAEVEKTLPDYKIWQKWLKTYGHTV